MDFTNKVIIITGASSGIGASAAKQLAKLSAKLVLVGRNKNKLNTVSETCEKAQGNKPLVIASDLSVDADVERIVKESVNHYGRIDILINNAGFGAAGSILDGVAAYDRVMATNVRAVYLLTSLVAPHLIETKGNIVNVSSTAGLMAIPRFLPYSVSKAALDQLTKCVALELAPKGVRVNSVNPGATRTNFLEAAGSSKVLADELYKKMSAMEPLGKVADSEEVADMIVYLASNRARSITGGIFVVDNGELLKGGMEFLDDL